MLIPVFSWIFFTSCSTFEEKSDPLVAEFVTAALILDENGPAVTIHIKFSGPSPNAGELSVSSTGAAYGIDYTTDPEGPDFSLSVPSGASGASFTFTPLDDADELKDKIINFKLTGVSGGLQPGNVTTCAVVIYNDDVELTGIPVNFATSSITVSETSTDTLSVDLSLGAAAVEGGTITITGPDAQFGTDYISLVDSVAGPEFDLAIAPGATEASFDVVVFNDLFNVQDQSVTFTISDATGDLQCGNMQRTCELTIINDDQVVDISSSAYTNSFDNVTLDESGQVIEDESFLSNDLLNFHLSGSKQWEWTNNKGTDSVDFHLEVTSQNSLPMSVYVVSWVITPACTNSSGSIKISLDAWNENEWPKGKSVSVMVSTDYIGEGDPMNYTWNERVVDVQFLEASDWQTWSCQAEGLTGNFYVAMVFKGSPSGFASFDYSASVWPLWRINNLKIEQW